MADTCQYCKYFHVPDDGKRLVSHGIPRYCIRFPQWVEKEFTTLACGEFEKVEEEAK